MPTKSTTPRSNVRKVAHLRLLNFILLFALIGTLFLHFTLAASSGWYYGSEADQVSRINSRRTELKINTLTWSGCLTNAAREHAKIMSDVGYIYHSDIGNLITRHCGGYGYAAGENVAGPSPSSAATWDAFMGSPCHQANLDSRTFVFNQTTRSCSITGGYGSRPFTHTGVGVWKQAGGNEFTVQLFVDAPDTRYGSFNQAINTNPSPAYDGTPDHTVIGNVEVANCRQISGWTFDKKATATSLPVHIYIDGVGFNTAATSLSRPDVNNAYSISGTHGFSFAVPEQYRDGKTHTAQIFGISATNTPNVLLAQRTLDACANPIGSVDAANCTSISGWTFDMNDVARSIDVHMYIDGTGYNTGAASLARPDVINSYRNYGVTGNHGFSYATPARWKDGRQHKVDVYGINVGSGGNALLRSTTFGPCS